MDWKTHQALTRSCYFSCQRSSRSIRLGGAVAKLGGRPMRRAGQTQTQNYCSNNFIGVKKNAMRIGGGILCEEFGGGEKIDCDLYLGCYSLLKTRKKNVSRPAKAGLNPFFFIFPGTYVLGYFQASLWGLYQSNSRVGVLHNKTCEPR